MKIVRILLSHATYRGDLIQFMRCSTIVPDPRCMALHWFNVEFTKLVTLQVHWIYCVVRRLCCFFRAVRCCRLLFERRLSLLLPILGAIISYFQTTNFITALIFISVFCSIHCTCILSFSFCYFIYIFMTNEWEYGDGGKAKRYSKNTHRERERAKRRLSWNDLRSYIITVV